MICTTEPFGNNFGLSDTLVKIILSSGRLKMNNKEKSRFISLLSMVLSNLENESLTPKDFHLFKTIFSPEFAEIAAKYHLSKHAFSLSDLRAMMVGMMTHVNAENLKTFQIFNLVLHDNKERKPILGNFSEEEVKIILESECPLMTAVYLASFDEEWDPNKLMEGIPEIHQKFYNQDQTELDNRFRFLFSYKKPTWSRHFSI